MALGKVPDERKSWLGHVAGYSVGGAASSALLGAALGAVGGLIQWPDDWLAVTIVLSVGVACVTREVFAPSAWIPQLRRQTPGRWAKHRGPMTAAVLWGIDIGLVLTTWFTFSGAWFVIALALLAGGPAQGALILLAYWSGRSLSVWLAPMMAVDAVHVPEFLDALESSRGQARLIHTLALVTCAVFILLSTGTGNALSG
jgi:cytochrome c biogenesis protein CcdA